MFFTKLLLKPVDSVHMPRADSLTENEPFHSLLRNKVKLGTAQTTMGLHQQKGMSD